MFDMAVNMILWNIKFESMIQEISDNEITFQEAFRWCFPSE